MSPGPLDVQAIRRHFAFPELGRIVVNNAASTQPPRELVGLYASLAPGYENVHRGQSSASRRMTAMAHNSNYVPWHALCREILPRLGRRRSAGWRGLTRRPGSWTWRTWRR